MKIKICGITRLEDARYAAGAGADFLGFIQFRQSPRFIGADSAREIISWVHGPEPVGVFVDQSANSVNDVIEKAGFRYAQLHGAESPELCADVAVPVIKSMAVFPDTSADDLRRAMAPYKEYVAFFLLDTGNARLRGGTGETFDWHVARDLAREFDFLLAGGLSSENVSTAIRDVGPWGVDVSSSIESSPGLKDSARMDAFFTAIRTAVALSDADQQWK